MNLAPDEPDDISIKTAECRGDFWCRLEDAMQKCGGAREHVLKKNFLGRPAIADMTVREACDLLAQNGVRMTFEVKWHMLPEIFTPEGAIIKTERTHE